MLRNIQDILKTPDEERRLLVFDDSSCLVINSPGRESQTEKTVVILGGRGSTSTENNITCEAGTPFRRELLRHGYMVLCPDCGSDNWGGPVSSHIVHRVLEQLPSAGIPVPQALPVMGFSMGALGTMMFAVRHPERVMRLVGVFGAYDLPDLRQRIESYRQSIDAVYPTPELLADSTPYTFIEMLRQFPVRLFHGQADSLVPCEYSQRLWRMLREAGGDATLEFVPNVGHSNDLLTLAKDSLLAALEEG